MESSVSVRAPKAQGLSIGGTPLTLLLRQTIAAKLEGRFEASMLASRKWLFSSRHWGGGFWDPACQKKKPPARG